MTIEELVKKHCTNCFPESGLRDALTEQAEAFKGELAAYDGTVRELTKTVEDMRDSLASAERERDELRKDADKWLDLCSRVGADPSGHISYAGPLEGAPEDWAAIAQGKGE